ncbi:hypothetical protein DFH09DRAFT_1089527 [Mycena vulgaris]|nr:hypothetical protein DFH09DRAFT_1089527 [Mycena vulgaris]
MSAASPTASDAGKENDTAEQLQNLKRRGDTYQHEVYNGRKKLKAKHATTMDQSSSLAESRVENGQLRAEVGQLTAEVAGLRTESSGIQASIGSYKSARSEASKQLHGKVASGPRRRPEARKELSQLFSFTLKEKLKCVVPDSTRDLINDLVVLDGVPPEQKSLGYGNTLLERWELRLPGTRRIALTLRVRQFFFESVTLSSDGTTHKDINLESRRATGINQDNKQHLFLGIGMAINHTSEKQLEGWEDLMETAYKIYKTSKRSMTATAPAAVAAAGGISAWERLGEEEHRARHNATLTDFVRGVGREEFDEWSDQDKQDVDLFMLRFYRCKNDGWTTVCPGLSSGKTETTRLPFLLPRATGAAARAEDRSCQSCWRYKANIESLVLLPAGIDLAGMVLKSLFSLRIPETGAVRWQGCKVEDRFATCKLLASFPSWSLPPRRKEVQIAATPSQTGALVDTIHDSPRHNDDNLLASLAHGHNDASPAITQLLQMASDAVSRPSETTSRLDALEGNVQMCSDTGSHRQHASQPAAVIAAPAPITFATPPLPTQVPAAPFVPPAVLAQAPFIAPVLAAVPARPVPTAIATQPALATADDNCMSDMQAMFTAALSAALGTKRAREVDDTARNRIITWWRRCTPYPNYAHFAKLDAPRDTHGCESTRAAASAQISARRYGLPYERDGHGLAYP